MSIAVIADTHNRLPGNVLQRLESAEAIWHLGDVCTPNTLQPILDLGRPLVIVRGNNDAYPYWPLYTRETLGNLRCFLIHIPPSRMPAETDIVLHGHTHVPRDEVVEGVRVLNPGCITRPNRGAPPSFAWLSLKADGEVDWRIELV
jgi:putative phosphoesterase